jgi:hypothetical protein
MARKPTPSVDATYNGNVAAEQDKVREYDWFAIFPPSVAELTPAQQQDQRRGLTERLYFPVQPPSYFLLKAPIMDLTLLG